VKKNVKGEYYDESLEIVDSMIFPSLNAMDILTNLRSSALAAFQG
jgi:hypothetical protein